MSGGGGQALVGKWGWVLDGEIDQIFANWGDPLVPPPRKNPVQFMCNIEKNIQKNMHWLHYKLKILLRMVNIYIYITSHL